MSNIEVQANSVIYGRQEYIAVLTAAKAAFAKLASLRDAQISAWLGDTAAREEDIERLLMERFTRYHRYSYEAYIERTKLPWWKKFLAWSHDNTDRYGSLEAYTTAKRGQTFQQFKETEHANIVEYGNELMEFAFMWLACNSSRFLDNEWADPLVDATNALDWVTYGTVDAQFVIPRSEFERYASAQIWADSGTIPEVTGRVRPSGEFYDL